MDTSAFFARRKGILTAAAGALLTAAVGAADWVTGYELGFSLFYLLPISFVSWLSGRWLGIASSVLGALVWAAADILAGHAYSSPLILAWNTLIRFGFFIIVTLLLSALRRSLEHERELSRIDSLTGAANSRFFLETLGVEIDRATRYRRPFTLVYFDLDNFKTVNDTRGHAEGDAVLHAVVATIRGAARKTDAVARLGGDEFALLLPETDGEAAQKAVSKIHQRLLEEMKTNGWPVTFSIGAVTCVDTRHGAEELLHMADQTMYTIKNAGKDAVRFEVVAG
jgi:diguanylate cyclase (GGDEF)-like protein